MIIQLFIIVVVGKAMAGFKYERAIKWSVRKSGIERQKESERVHNGREGKNWTRWDEFIGVPRTSQPKGAPKRWFALTLLLHFDIQAHWHLTDNLEKPKKDLRILRTAGKCTEYHMALKERILKRITNNLIILFTLKLVLHSKVKIRLEPIISHMIHRYIKYSQYYHGLWHSK